MKRKHILWAAFASLLCVACVEDEGSNHMVPINELEVEGIEENYTKVGYQEKLEIEVTLKGSLSGADENAFDFQWFLCNRGTDESSHRHQVIATTKDLVFPLEVPSGYYSLYFRATDKATGMQWEKYTQLQVTSAFVRGFYLWGDKEDGSCGMDFISMIENKDTTVIEDIFTNPTGMKHAKNLVFTGNRSDVLTSLWAFSEGEFHSVEHQSALREFGILPDERIDKIIYPTIEVNNPTYDLVDIYPHAYGKLNTCTSSNWRVLMTEGDIFCCTNMVGGEGYANPMNRYSTNSKELYQPAPYVFHQNAGYLSSAAYYDMTNHCFTVHNAATYALSHTVKCADTSGTPFYFDQTKYDPVRDLVYGENADANSYALMKDANGGYFIYKFAVQRYGANGVKKVSAATIDKKVATDFDKATHYTFFAKQPVILYAVGTHLYAYNYNLNLLKEVENPDGGEITYLAMDFASNETPTDFIFATYREAEKGTVYKYTIEDNQNTIEVKPHDDYETDSYPWRTKLKVKKIEYRNSPI